MKREPIVIREWRQGESRYECDFINDLGPVPPRHAARIAELRQAFANAYEATRRMSVIPRVASVARCNVYEQRGELRGVENRTYEAHCYGLLVDIDGENCAAAVHALGETAGRWAESLAEAAGIPLTEAVLQERLEPTVLDIMQRDWNLYIGWHARGAIMRAPIGTLVLAE